MSDAPIIIDIRDKVSANVSKKIRAIGKDSDAAHSHVQKLKRALDALSKSNPVTKLKNELRSFTTETLKAAAGTQKLATEQAKTATANQRLATEQQRTAQTAARVATEQARTATAQQRTATTANQAATASQRLATEQQRTAAAASAASAAQSRAAAAALRLEQAQTRAEARTRSFTRSTYLLRSALAFGGVTLTAGAIVGMADGYTVLQNKLQIVAESQAQVNELTLDLFSIANKTRTGVQATGQAFVRFDRAMKGLGRSQQDTLRLTETVNKLLIVSGATATEASSSLLQLSQAFNKGALNGDEFRTISENMPLLLDALAQSMGKPVGALKEMGAAGKISAADMITAIELVQNKIDQDFANTIPTIGQAFTVLRNQASQLFGEFNSAAGLTDGLAKAILFLADNLKQIVITVTIAAAYFAGAYVAGLVSAAVATGGLTGALVLLRGAILKTGIGALIIFAGDLVFEFLRLTELVGGMSSMFTILGQTGTAILQYIGNSALAMVDVFSSITLSIRSFFQGLWASILSGFAAMMQKLQAGINTMIGGINDAFTFSVTNPITGNVIAEMDGLISKTATFADGFVASAETAGAAADKLGERAGAALESAEERFNSLESPLQTFKDLSLEAAKANEATQTLQTTLRGETEPTNTGTTGGGGGGGGGAIAAKKELTDLQKTEKSLLDATVEKRKEYITQIQAIKNLLADETNGFTNADALEQISQMEVGAYLNHLPEMVEARVEQFNLMYSQVNELRKADLISEQSASAAKMQIWAAEQKAKTQVFSDFFGGIAQLASSENEKIARIGKAAAITQTIIQTYQSATAAYASMAGIPVIGPALGAAAAAAAVAAGLANVAAIRSQGTGFMSGGYTGDVPRSAVAGQVHGREYVMDAGATSRIGKGDLDALRRGAATVQRPDNESGAGQRVSAAPAATPAANAEGNSTNIRVVNVVDPAVVGDYMGTPEGEQVVLNVMRRNKDQLQAIQNG